MKWYVVEGASPDTVQVGAGVAVKQDPEPVVPVWVITHVVPVGFDGGVQVSTALVEVVDVTDKMGAFRRPATARPYVPELVAEKNA
jgi:hypothetical protein